MSSKYTINVQDIQKEWLKKYTKVGNQQLDKSENVQKYLKRNIFRRFFRREEIRDNERYIESLRGALIGVETQQELYLHTPIELTAPSRMEEPLLRDMVQSINESYNEKIQACIEKLTLDNFEYTYHEYREYALDLSNMKTADYMKNQVFPSLTEALDPERWEVFILDTEYRFDEREGDFYKLPTTKEYPDRDVMAYLSNQNSFHKTGDIQYLNEAESIKTAFSSDTLKKINDFVDESINEYKTEVSRFTPFDFDVNPIFKEVDRLKDYLKFPKQSIVLQENKEKKDQFIAIYDSLSKEEQTYLDTFNEFFREELMNAYSDTVEGRSNEQRDLLAVQQNHLSVDQVERLKAIYHEYVSTSIHGAEPGKIHMDNFSEVIQEGKKLQLENQESLVNTLSQLTSEQREYLQQRYMLISLQDTISNLSEALYENDELMNYSESQQQSITSFEKENESIMEEIDKRGELSEKTKQNIQDLDKKLTDEERKEVRFIVTNVDEHAYEDAIKKLGEREAEGKESIKTPTVYSLGGSYKMTLQGNKFKETGNTVEIKNLFLAETGKGSEILGRIHNLTEEEAEKTLNYPFDQKFTDKFLSIGDSFSHGDPEPTVEVKSFAEALKKIDKSNEEMHVYEDIIVNYETAGRDDIVKILKDELVRDQSKGLRVNDYVLDVVEGREFVVKVDAIPYGNQVADSTAYHEETGFIQAALDPEKEYMKPTADQIQEFDLKFTELLQEIEVQETQTNSECEEECQISMV